ncbi:ferritin-like domain-containing protein [Sorangium sp. So ce327]|jgi:rubrerythrin|uniref:ferritin-like domain-containing protein n=1 Tax=Sorangium sp. So ce327 TaxID=3133301 RepID=UPI003F5DB27E
MKQIKMGTNTTGIATSPIDSKELIEFAQVIPPSSPGSEAEAAAVRSAYARESGTVGSVPPPASLKGVVKAAGELIQGRPPALLIDKLGERLQFERSGTRLYEALIAKHDAEGTFEGGPTRADLEAIRDDELRHFALLKRAIERLGADPTAMTPGADVIGLASSGVLAVAVEPRINLGQSLQALLVAELTDNDSWRMLIDLAIAYGQDEMAAEFRVAEQHEAIHLERVRAWLSSKLALDARGEPTSTTPQQAA